MRWCNGWDLNPQWTFVTGLWDQGLQPIRRPLHMFGRRDGIAQTGISKKFDKSLLNEAIEQGWFVGRRCSRFVEQMQSTIPINKNKKLSIETRRKMSSAKIGKTLSETHKEKISIGRRNGRGVKNRTWNMGLEDPCDIHFTTPRLLLKREQTPYWMVAFYH